MSTSTQYGAGSGLAPDAGRSAPRCFWRGSRGERGFVTMWILLLAAMALLLLECALSAHRHLLTTNRRLATEIQQRADSLGRPAAR